MRNKIIVTKDSESIINYHKNHFDGDVIVYCGEELLIETSREIIDKAYFSSERQVLNILSFKSFKIEAQNALLKIFEEPPSGIFFMIVSPSKNLLLPTVRSRFVIEKYNVDRDDYDIKIDFLNFDYADFYSFVNTYSNIDKEDMLKLLQTIGRKYSHVLKCEDLEDFFTCFELVKLNAKNDLILSKIGFIFLRNR